MAGILISQIEEVLGAGDLAELKRFTYEALKRLADTASQVPVILTDGSPENELKAARGGMIAFDRSTGKFYVKELGEIGGDQRRGWREGQFV